MTNTDDDEFSMRWALIKEAFGVNYEYSTDDYTPDDCIYCESGHCVQRVEHYDEGDLIIHGCQNELN